MARVAGVNIPDHKRAIISLTYVYGVGPKASAEILELAKIDPATRIKDLSEVELNTIREIISEKYQVEADLQRIVTGNIKRLRDIKTYRGLRHAANLPVRGQRTKTNARTKRGRKMAVSGAQPKSATKT